MGISPVTIKLMHLLYVQGINSAFFNKVFRQYGRDMARVFSYFGLDRKVDRCSRLDRIIYQLKRDNLRVLNLTDKQYPELLKNIALVPPLLFLKGRPVTDNFKIAVVGTRKPSDYGKKVAADLGRQLSRAGITVVSGMAKGIDGCAQQASLAGKGGSIGVLGNGIGYIYPKSNFRLFGEIVENGCLVSEYLPLSKPRKKNFVYRNRIISGLANGVVVIESAEKGGALITANFATEQGREVFAVPGNIYSRASRGTNNLIQKGAKLVSSIDSILEEFNYI